MDEAEWLACKHTELMLGGILRGRLSDRKLRLFACACVRRILHLSTVKDTNAITLRAVETAERYADGEATAEELAAANDSSHLNSLLSAICSPDGLEAARRCAFTAEDIFAANNTGMDLTLAERAKQTPLLRDIAGNPFRQIVRFGSTALIRDERLAVHIDVELLQLPHWLAWNNGVVRKIAGVIYDDRRFEDMSILADALEDAGCGNADILSHLRGPGPHVRGCWVVDLLLGKE